MRSDFRRKILIGIGAALLWLLLVLALLPSFIDLDRYRGAIVAKAGKALGRKVSLGSLRLSLLWPGAEVRGVRIAERPGFGEGPFLEAEALEVKVELLPLLVGRVKVTKAVLDRPRIVIVHDGALGWNIDDLIKQPSAVSYQPSAGDQKSEIRDHRSKAPVPRPPSSVPFLPALSLSELEVRRGQLIVVEAKAGRASISRIADFSFKASQPSLDAPIAFRLRAVLPPPPSPPSSKGEGMGGGLLELDGKADPKAEGLPLEAALRVRDLEVQFSKSFLGGGGSAASPQLGAGLDIAGRLDLELKVHGPWNRLGLEGELNLDRLKIVYAGFRKAEGEEGKLKVKGIGRFAALGGWWSPGRVAQGREEEEELTLDQVDLNLKGLKLSGRMSLASLKNPKVRFFLSSPSLDLDRLSAGPLQPPTPKLFARGVAWASPETGGQKPPPPNTPHPPSSIPSGFSAEGKIQVADLHLSGLTFQNLTSDVLYRQAVLHLRRLTASLYGGRLWADLTLDLSRRYPSLLLSSRLEGVETGPFLQALKEVPWNLEGILSLRSTIAFHGLTPWGLGAASGWGSLIIEKGRLKGHKPFDRFIEAFAPLLRSEGGGDRLEEFDRLQGEFTLEKGFVRTRDLTLRKGRWQLLATGTLGLLDSSLHFDLVVKLPRATWEATLSGTTAEPLVVPKGGHLWKRVEMELPKRKGLKNLFRELFQ